MASKENTAEELEYTETTYRGTTFKERTRDPFAYVGEKLRRHKVIVPETRDAIYELVREYMPPDPELVAEGVGITMHDLKTTYSRVYRLAILEWWKKNYNGVISRKVSIEFIKWLTPILQPSIYRKTIEMQRGATDEGPKGIVVDIGDPELRKQVRNSIAAVNAKSTNSTA